MKGKHRVYLEKLDGLHRNIKADFEFYRNQRSLIDRRINELSRRGNVKEVVDEMAELLEYRAIVKDRSLKLLPLYDLFKNGYDEVVQRVEKFESYNGNNN